MPVACLFTEAYIIWLRRVLKKIKERGIIQGCAIKLFFLSYLHSLPNEDKTVKFTIRGSLLHLEDMVS